jgi:Cu/Ag efflux protein CusF
MQRFIAPIAFVACTAIAAPGLAQTTDTIVGKGPGVAGAAQTTKVTATITKIDAATREVTLKGPKGGEMTIQAGPEVKNFAQMKVGDTVNAEYVEALTLELKKGGKAVVGRTEKAGAAAAKPGEKPAALAGRQLTIVADVIAVDPATQMVTLKGPNRTVDLKVADPEQFKLIKVGDQVEANYTEALAIAVEPAKK